MDELEGKRAGQRLSRWLEEGSRRRIRKWNDMEQCKWNKWLMSCTNNDNSLTYDTCAIKPMNNNGKPRKEAVHGMKNVEVWFNIKSAWMDLQRKWLCCSLHGSKRLRFFLVVDMDCTPIPKQRWKWSLTTFFLELLCITNLLSNLTTESKVTIS